MTLRHLSGAGRAAAFLFVYLFLLLTATALAGLPYQEPRRTGPPPADAKGPWAEMDRLIWDEKMNEALEIAEKLLATSRAADDQPEWTRALVRTVQLRMAVTSFEAGLGTLEKEPWPADPAQRAVLNLFRAEALHRYFDQYYWEIARRERVATGTPSLELWTRDEVFAAILTGYVEVWQERERLGEVPAARLSDFVDPGTYPAEVRGTVRDVVTHQLAGLLADRRSWSPRQESEVYRLDLGRLLRLSGEQEGLPAAPERLRDLEVHPLERLAAVLADLEAWHRSAGRRAGELEARLERVRQLRSAFSRPEDRQALRRHLEEALPAWRDLPWWAMGMAELAESFRQELEHDPEALVRAHAAARAGREAYPDSPGGQRCAAIVREIEAPDYRIESMSSDGVGRRSIRVTHKNLPALYFRAYRLADGELSGLDGDQPERAEVLRQTPVASWRADLAPTPDFREHATYVTPALDRKGAYRIVVSTGEGFAPARDRIESFKLTLGDLVLASRYVDPHAPTDLEVLALSGPTGEPVAGAEVQLFLRGDRGAHRAGPAGTSGRDGTVRLALPPNQHSALRGRLRDDATWIPVVYGYGPGTGETPAAASLVYTDRSAYRPLQKVLWKVLAFRAAGARDAGRFEPLAGTSVQVRLLDPNGEAVAETTVTTGDYGTASGEMTIPAGRRLGYWRLETSASGSAMFRVEEYKRPTFEVAVEDPAEPLRLNRPAVLTGRARYYFGLPVSAGEVRWKVERRPYYFWWWGDGGLGGSEVVASGTSSLAEDGTFRIELTPAADEREAQGESRFAISYYYHVTADVTDEGRETRTGQRSFRLGWTSVEARIGADAGFFRSGQPAALSVARTNLDGLPRPGEGKWTLVELAQPSAAAMPADLPYTPLPGYRTPGDDLAPRWNIGYEVERVLASWPDGREVAGGALQHGPDGEARVTLPADLPPGAYRLRYETVDDFGAPYRTARDLIVTGPRTPLALAAVLRVEEPEVRVGGTARVLAHSGFPGQTLFLEVYRSGRLAERRRLTGGESPAVIEIPIRREDRGGFGLRLLALRDHQLVQLDGAVRVPWDGRELAVELSSFRDKVVPGGRETWKVSVKKGTADSPEVEAAEVLAYMYDRSLDVFNAHQPPDVLRLYPDRRGVGSLQASLGTSYPRPLAWEGWPPRLPPAPELAPGRFTLFDGWAIQGTPSARVLRFVQPFLEKVRRQARGGQVSGNVAEFATAMTAPAAAQDMESMEEVRLTSAPPPPPPPPAPAQPQPPAAELRRDFAETAFWFPHLLTGADGTASLEFTVPDSLTSWNVWVHAVTRDLRAGSARREVRSAKDLMVRPYLPRFLREGDRAEIKVVVDNASAGPLSGEVTFDILDPETGASRLADFGLAGDTAAAARRPFSAGPGASASVTFAVAVPRGVGEVHFRVTAAAGGLSDGELRPLPVLPSRLRLVQSRFAAVRNGESRTLRFADLEKGADPTRENEQLVVTLDAQLFYGVLAAVPYLVNYPYECTEQTLNRFLSTGIVASLFDRYPAVARMGGELAKRDTLYETWDQVDPNRKIALEETPWLELAQGGPKGDRSGQDLIRILDPRIARAEREASLDKLEKAQLASGAFPWFPGGPESPGMTLYLLHGFAKAVEHGVEVPKPMVEQAWGYLGRHYQERYAATLGTDKECCWELLTFLNYVATAFPDDSWTGGALPAAEQVRILDASLRNWRSHSPYLQAMLALTLKRKGRAESAARVFDSLLDAAKTTPEEGTFWEPQAYPWLWYNDSVEGHAFILRALMEIAPEDPRRHGMVQWLFLNKKLNHWKSTRATAEALYALVHYLDKEGQLGAREAVKVRVGTREESLVFEPDRYTGKKNQVVVPGEEVDPARSAVTVDPETPGLMFASATWHFSTDELPKEGSGDLFAVSRRYFRRVREGEEMVLQPLAEGAVLQAGDEVEVQLVLKSRAPAEYVHLRDPRPAGFEPGVARSGYRWGQGLFYYEETRDSGANFFVEYLPAGEYTLRYRVRANVAGTFRSGPATLQSMYAPEFAAYSAGEVVRVQQR